jgi:hypothetical protein
LQHEKRQKSFTFFFYFKIVLFLLAEHSFWCKTIFSTEFKL